jgi:hypothetical protein
MPIRIKSSPDFVNVASNRAFWVVAIDHLPCGTSNGKRDDTAEFGKPVTTVRRKA